MKRKEAAKIERKALLKTGTKRTLVMLAVLGVFVAISKIGEDQE